MARAGKSTVWDPNRGALANGLKDRRLIIWLVLWCVGLLLFVGMCVAMRLHPGSWPLELATTKLLQGPHPVPCRYTPQQATWVDRVVDLTDKFDDPIESVAIPGAWMLLLALLRKFRQALFLGLTVLTASSVWAGMSRLIARPRMTPQEGVCVHRAIAAGSFPSGHVMHDFALYGFLFFLTLTGPVRRWRYYKPVILPLQALAVIYLLLLGYSRLESGEHHLFDVLGAYLAGALWLGICIAVYLWVTHLWLVYGKRRQRRGDER